MFLSFFDIIAVLMGFISLAVWLFFYIKGKPYAEMFNELDDEKWRMKDLYFVGYSVLETIGYKYKSKGDRKLRKEVEILYEAKYVEYYIRVIHAQQMTMGLTVLVLAFILYGFMQEPVALLLFIFLAGVIYVYFGRQASQQIINRSEELMSDFSEVISKLALLTNAGMILREAWETVAIAGETEVYQEMRRSIDNMNNGMAEIDAYHDFGRRCMVPEIKKFCSTIIQGVSKGNAELVIMLEDQSKEIWDAKKQLVRRKGEKAATKLLLPMMVMFIGIMLMIIVPIFSNLGV